MIAKLAIWYVKRYTNEFWEAYNEGFFDGINSIPVEEAEE